MSLIKWTVWNPVTRRPKRSGQVDETLLDRITFDPVNERMLIGEEAVLRLDEVSEDGQLRRLPQAVVDAEREAKLAAIEPTESEIVLEALLAKHGLTPADLSAAEARIKARRG
jgi:hypothetical protein